MAQTGQVLKALSRFPALRLGSTLVLAAALFGSHDRLGGRYANDSLVHAQSRSVAAAAQRDRGAPAVLWREPEPGARHGLFYGPGGADHQPDAHGTFTFIKEDLEGSQPKFEVHDADGVQWIVKLGTEARPETVASRLVWAAGYAADEDYFVDAIHVSGLPGHLNRGQRFIDGNGIARNVRLKRESDDRQKIGIWSWRRNPFSATQPFNGLRVLMAVINNWDVKDVNNAIYEVKPGGDHTIEHVFEVKDVGSSFGSTGLGPTSHANGNLDAYRSSRFITHLGAESVSFATPRLPDLIVFANAPEFFRRTGLTWIGKNIPRSDARWMGHILSQIPPDQIRNAFRAAEYSPSDIEGFATILEARIQQLNHL